MTNPTPGCYVRDDYGNPAIVTVVRQNRVSIIQLAGSDYGRASFVHLDRAVEIVEPGQLVWAARRVLDLDDRATLHALVGPIADCEDCERPTPQRLLVETDGAIDVCPLCLPHYRPDAPAVLVDVVPDEDVEIVERQWEVALRDFSDGDLEAELAGRRAARAESSSYTYRCCSLSPQSHEMGCPG